VTAARNRFRQARELVFARRGREIREQEEREPIGRRFIKGAQYSWMVAVARMALEQGVGLFTAVAPEIGVQQIYHGHRWRPSSTLT